MPKVFISYSTKDAVFADLAKMKLTEIITGAVALATASAKSTGHGAKANDISSAAESMVGAMRQAAVEIPDEKKTAA